MPGIPPSEQPVPGERLAAKPTTGAIQPVPLGENTQKPGNSAKVHGLPAREIAELVARIGWHIKPAPTYSHVPTTPYSEHAVPCLPATELAAIAVAVLGRHVTDPAAPNRVHVPATPPSEHDVPTAFCVADAAEIVNVGAVQVGEFG